MEEFKRIFNRDEMANVSEDSDEESEDEEDEFVGTKTTLARIRASCAALSSDEDDDHLY